METKNQPPQPVEKVEVSAAWTDKERLALSRLIAQDLAKAFSPSDKGWFLQQIDMLTSADADFLEVNRSNYSKYISEPSSE